MKLKYALWATAVWTVLWCAGVGVGLWYTLTHPIPGVRDEDRAAKFGQGTATVITIGYAAIWLPYAYQVGKRRREGQKRNQRDRDGPRKNKPRG